MAHADFVHLRVHTAYSLSEGAIHVKDLVKQCVGMHMPAVGMTDTDNIFAGLEFSTYAAEAGVQPIIGVTLSVKNPYKKQDAHKRALPDADELVLLAQNDKGYRNLIKLVSRAHLESDPQHGVQLPLDAFEGFSDGIICLTGGPGGPIGSLLLAGKEDDAKACLTDLMGYFPNRLYIELMRHNEENEQDTEDAFIDFAYSMNLPLVATNRPYFVGADMYQAHDTLLCIADGTYVAESERRKLNTDYRFKDASEMVVLFKDLPEAIENTMNIARRCSYKVDMIDPLLPNFTRGLDLSEADLLRDETIKGLNERLDFKAAEDRLKRGKEQDWEKEYWDRLDYELGIINQMGFPGYFLIVSDFIQWAKDHNIPVGPGRGSGAGSLVAWALKITDLDPLRFSLLFERFLNPERVSMPDFDIDFCQDKREQVIRYVQDKYGSDHVAQIITFGKLQARAVVKAVGRVMQQPYPVSDRLSKLIPNEPGNAMTLAEAIKSETRLQAEIDTDELTRQVIDRALKLEGLFAHSSTHAAGVVIGDRPLDELVPLYRDPKSDMPVTQFNMKWVEQAGLVKFDFLGLKTLTVLDRAISYVKKRGIEINLATVPLDDRLSYEMLAKGESAGVFQLESTGMRAVLKGLQPDKFEDIIAIVALYRPGPMANIPTYVNRKHGREEVVYPHDMLSEILGETYGVIIYQEQVMQIAQVLSGYSLGEADLLRRAMGKKIAAEMEKQRARFCSGAKENGINQEKASYIFDLVAKFAEYGFNKSHAAAYALVAYHTAYLKANYPAEFMAAIMTLDLSNTDKLSVFKQELQRMEIPLMLPDINASDVHFTVEKALDQYCEEEDDPRHNLGVRYALAAIKGVGEKAMEAVVAERQANGLYKDIFDFAERIDPKLLNKRQLEKLAAAGAFDGMIEARSQAFSAAEIIMRTAQMAMQERESSQVSLFGDATGLKTDRLSLPVVKAWTDTEMLDHERKAVGFYVSAHPLDVYENILLRERIVPAREVFSDEGMVGQEIRMAGAILSYREGKAKKSGRTFGALTLSDRTDAFELLVFEDALDFTRSLVEEGAPLVVTVQIRKKDGDDMVRLSCRAMESLEQVAAQSSKGLIITLEGEDAVLGMKAALERKRGGKGKVTVRVPVHDEKRIAEIRVPGRFKVTPDLKQAISAERGVIMVDEI